jgi:hypothetical protein
VALTNNRYSSDVIAVGRARNLRDLPPLPSDNALPRWLEERAGYEVAELWARRRLALTWTRRRTSPLVALPSESAEMATQLRGARQTWRSRALDAIRALAAKSTPGAARFRPSSSAATLKWLQKKRSGARPLSGRGARHACLRVRWQSATQWEPTPGSAAPGPRLDCCWTSAARREFSEIVSSLGDGAIVDSRVLLAHRLGSDEEAGLRPPTDLRATCCAR